MSYLAGLSELALGSRLKALSEALYDTADAVYIARGSKMRGRWLPVLRLLLDQGPRSVSEIARDIGQTHSALSQLANRLKREGWLSDAIDPKDQRRRVLALTASAHAALCEIKPVWRSVRDVLQERMAQAGVELLPTLARFENEVLLPDLAEAIVTRCKTRDQSALRIVPFTPELRGHFYELNAAWLACDTEVKVAFYARSHPHFLSSI